MTVTWMLLILVLSGVLAGCQRTTSGSLYIDGQGSPTKPNEHVVFYGGKLEFTIKR